MSGLGWKDTKKLVDEFDIGKLRSGVKESDVLGKKINRMSTSRVSEIMEEERRLDIAPYNGHWNDEMVEELHEYFNISNTMKRKRGIKDKNGNVAMVEEIVANVFPTFEGFFFEKKITPDAFWEYADKYVELRKVIDICRQKQTDYLIDNGIHKRIDSSFSTFVAKNLTSLKDKQEVDLTSGGNPMVAMLAVIASKEDEKSLIKGGRQVIEEGQIVRGNN